MAGLKHLFDIIALNIEHQMEIERAWGPARMNCAPFASTAARKISGTRRARAGGVWYTRVSTKVTRRYKVSVLLVISFSSNLLFEIIFSSPVSARSLVLFMPMTSTRAVVLSYDTVSPRRNGLSKMIEIAANRSENMP
jgi:hypothetical protein